MARVRFEIFSYNEFSVGKKRNLDFKVNFFQEQDLKNQSIQPELNVGQKQFLSSIGDHEQNAYYDFVDSAENGMNRILYCKKDTVVEGTVYESVYEYSTDASQQLYSLGFTYMGPHKGSYVLLRSTSNGRVFGWVSPKDGEPQGDYSPVMRLSTPKLVQMATIQAEYAYHPKSFVKTELALSNYDQNIFSKQDDKDNVGFAFFLKANHEQEIGKKQVDDFWKFASSIEWQFVHKNFHAVESFREVIKSCELMTRNQKLWQML